MDMEMGDTALRSGAQTLLFRNRTWKRSVPHPHTGGLGAQPVVAIALTGDGGSGKLIALLNGYELYG